MQQNSIGIQTPDAVDVDEAARKRAAVELIAKHGASLRRTARRYSLNAEDAEDAYQRSLEILLTKAPNDRMNELVRWTHTVIKHEALAVRRKRERLLGGVPQSAEDPSREDWVAMIPATGDGPDRLAERGELIARSREALRTLKPAELRALTLLAEGYSYAEIGEITGFSQTKVNRCLAEGRERFRSVVARSEDGSRCAELRPLLSAFCDGEASAKDAAAVREHLRACAGCRATMRAYGATAGAAAALAPVLPDRSVFDRLHDLPAAIQARLPFGGGGGGDSAITQVAAAGGTRGAGNGGAGETADDLRRCRRGRRRLRGRRRNPGAADRCPPDEDSHRRARLEDRVRGHRSRIRRTGAGADRTRTGGRPEARSGTERAGPRTRAIHIHSGTGNLGRRGRIHAATATGSVAERGRIGRAEQRQRGRGVRAMRRETAVGRSLRHPGTRRPRGYRRGLGPLPAPMTSRSRAARKPGTRKTPSPSTGKTRTPGSACRSSTSATSSAIPPGRW